MSRLPLHYLVVALLIVIPLYPKFPLLGVTGTFVAVRLEDFLVAAVLSTWFVTQLKARFPSLRLSVPRSILLYLFVGGASLFSAVFLTKSVTPQLGTLHFLRRLEYMLLFPAAYDLFSPKVHLSLVVRTILLTSALVALYGLGQQYLSFPVISTTNSEFAKGLALRLGPGARINSTFAGHYDLAAYSVFPLLLALGLLMINTKHKLITLTVGLLTYWSMLLSASRVTFAAFFVSAGLFVWLMRRRLWLIPLTLLAVASVLATPQLLGRYRELVLNHLLTFAPPVAAQSPPVDEQTADALKPALTPEDRSLNIRLKAEWPKALRAFQKNPVFGTGFSSVGLAVDNDYLRLLAETGALGLAAFALVIVRLFKTSYSYLHSSPTSLSQVFIAATSLSLLALLLNALFIDVFEASKIAIFSWTVLGLSHKVQASTHP